MAPRVFLQRGEELRAAKIRPQRLGDDELGIGNLPKQKIAHPQFTARSDQLIRIGIMMGVKVLGDELLIDLARVELPRLGLRSYRAHTFDDFLPATAHLEQIDPECRLHHVAQHPVLGRPVEHAMSLSAGFGGTNVALTVSKEHALPNKTLHAGASTH